jgi:hypothetical protein
MNDDFEAWVSKGSQNRAGRKLNQLEFGSHVETSALPPPRRWGSQNPVPLRLMKLAPFIPVLTIMTRNSMVALVAGAGYEPVTFGL